ncbi:hypothetical protein Pint_26506 [Pistacia integerrima]|uniref:Uncharacterized protein n=1 Tax=Pistacia integerrima TaxID=434235 RepID=A0ACC0YEA5_9ROSI|nr:hypothetical protein Pint_26506 [Pistacia integerrima]
MNLAFTADWNSQQSFTFSNCFNLTEDAQRNILADAELRIQVMATNARETASMEDYLERLYAMLVQRDDQDHFFSMYQSCHKVLFEFLPVDDNQLPLLNCKVKKCGVCILNLKEEDAEIFDSSNVDEHVESGSDSNSNHEVQEDPNSQTLKEKETNLEANAFWLAQGRAKLLCINFLVGLAVVLFLRHFLGVVTVNGFKKLLVSLLQ